MMLCCMHTTIQHNCNAPGLESGCCCCIAFLSLRGCNTIQHARTCNRTLERGFRGQQNNETPGGYSPGFFLPLERSGGHNTRPASSVQERRVPVARKKHAFHLTTICLHDKIKLEEAKELASQLNGGRNHPKNGGEMALTRSMLKGMQLTDEQVSAIVDAHTETVNGLKAERDKYKADAAMLSDVQKELDTLKSSNWEEKYNSEHTAFENYKNDVVTKETNEKIKSAYRKLLSDCKVNEKQLDAIMKVTDFSGMKLNKDNGLEGLEDLKKTISKEWSGFIPTEETKGADVDTPPGSGGPDGKKTGRAAELAAKYHDNLYGKVKEN